MTPEEKQQFEFLLQDHKYLMDLYLNHQHLKYDQSLPLNIPIAGVVHANGTTIKLPGGWKSAKTGTGSYQITHNLGNALYAVVVSSANGTFCIGELDGRSEDFFNVSFVDHTGTATDCDFTFILTML